MKMLSALGLGILLLMQPVLVAAGAPGDQVRQTVDKLLAILADPQLRGEDKENERREELRKVLYSRFDFTEMAKSALGPHWQRRSPEEQKEFVELFTSLLEGAYLLKVDRMSDVLTLPAVMGAFQPPVADGSPFVLLDGQSGAVGGRPTPTLAPA
jgi:phospholipid transport system substrate-binding protein